MPDRFDPTRLLGTAALAMAASVGAAVEHVPLGHFAAAIAVLSMVGKVARVAWKAWKGAEAWLDHRMEQAFSRGIAKLELPCMMTGGAICDPAGEFKRPKRTPLPQLHPPLDE